MVTDPIADFVNRLKTASATRKEAVSLPYSKMKHAIALKLQACGYIDSVERKGKKTVRKTLEIVLAYDKNGVARIHDVKRQSKPGRRVYLGAKEVRPVRQGRGTLLLSTPQGILTGSESRKANIGGESLFTIW